MRERQEKPESSVEMQWGPKKVATYIKEGFMPHLKDYQDTELEVPEEEGRALEVEAVMHNVIVRFEVLY